MRRTAWVSALIFLTAITFVFGPGNFIGCAVLINFFLMGCLLYTINQANRETGRGNLNGVAVEVGFPLGTMQRESGNWSEQVKPPGRAFGGKRKGVLESCVRSNSWGFLAVDVDGRITELNLFVSTILGGRKDLVGEGLDTVARFNPSLASLLRKNLRSPCNLLEEIPVIADGECKLTLLARSETLLDSRNDISGAAAFLIDVTLEKERTAALQEQERLAAIGEVAAGIAHEIRQPMTIIKGFAQLMKKEAGLNQKLGGYSKVIMNEMDRLDDVISEFLELSKPIKLAISTTTVEAVLEEMTAAIRDYCAPRGIAVNINKNVLPPEIEIDVRRVKRVIWNIVGNAVESIEEKGQAGGSIDIDTGQEDEHVTLRIRDSGLGIPVDHMNRIFAPFFTTKPHATGLGLSVCRNIISQHQGRLEVASEEGLGTEVKIMFARRLSWVKGFVGMDEIKEAIDN